MKPSERFLNALRPITDDRTLEHLAVRLDPVLTAADGGPYPLGVWDAFNNRLTSADGDAVIDGKDIRRNLGRALGFDVSAVFPVRLEELNAPRFTTPWMTADAADSIAPQGSYADAMALSLVRSIEEPINALLRRRWCDAMEREMRAVVPALEELAPALDNVLAVRFAADVVMAVPSFGATTLPKAVRAILIETLQVFIAAALIDHGKALLALAPTIYLLDSCIPLGTKADDDHAVLLLVR